jgi:hypothetical protein
MEADARQCTYLAIDWSQGRKFDEVNDYDYEGGYPRKGVNLNEEEESVPGIWGNLEEIPSSDPYGPTVLATPSDDTPLKVQGSEEFPTAKRNLVTIRSSSERRCNTQEDAIRSMPELHHRHCWNTDRLELKHSKSTLGLGAIMPQKHTHRYHRKI